MNDNMRSLVVEESYSWLKTPWHHAACLKGIGVDCAHLLIGVYSNVGLIPVIETGYYPIDWHLHKNEPKFMNKMLEHVDPVELSLPGDIAMFHYGRQAAHGAIVVEWPLIIHAWRDENMVVLTDVDKNPIGKRLFGLYRLKDT